ncbi:hypothetical protein N657DRAFT_134515 [Parathielavia appendiculata]|uniref:Uncharacterized protein n=1 Tax=Parathielavia appendiculata TaxID=2587402 RepID=A0AAN6TUM1_9PEZI|nr:hypothetical protein N657DRAFT_134515 [Parathielavia appendiculata]
MLLLEKVGGKQHWRYGTSNLIQMHLCSTQGLARLIHIRYESSAHLHLQRNNPCSPRSRLPRSTSQSYLNQYKSPYSIRWEKSFLTENAYHQQPPHRQPLTRGPITDRQTKTYVSVPSPPNRSFDKPRKANKHAASRHSWKRCGLSNEAEVTGDMSDQP